MYPHAQVRVCLQENCNPYYFWRYNKMFYIQCLTRSVSTIFFCQLTILTILCFWNRNNKPVFSPFSWNLICKKCLALFEVLSRKENNLWHSNFSSHANLMTFSFSGRELGQLELFYFMQCNVWGSKITQQTM